MSPSSTQPGIQLSLDQRTMLATCVTDLLAVNVSRSLSDGLLVSGTSEGPLEVTAQVAAAVSRLGEENVARWRRLSEASPFIVSLSEHVSDPYLEHGLRVAEMQAAPGIALFRERAYAEGGPAAYVRARMEGVPDSFAAELDRAIALYRYFVSWPGGFRAEGPAESLGLATDDAVGCAGGIALVAAGGMLLGATLAAEVLSAGAATPAAFAAAGAAGAMMGSGAAAASAQC